MVVEDGSLLSEYLSLLLQDFGHSVVDADDAIGISVKSVKRVDLVVADMDIARGDIPRGGRYVLERETACDYLVK